MTNRSFAIPCAEPLIGRMLKTMTSTGQAAAFSSTLRAAVARVRSRLPIPCPPAYVEPAGAPWQERLRRLDRIRAALEQGRFDLLRDGWTRGGWFSVADAAGRARPTSTAEAFAVLGSGAPVRGACLVGALLRQAGDPDRATSVADVWGCVDELVEALHEQAGYTGFPPGRCYPPTERRTRLRTLTAWNDTSGRTRAEVVGLLDRAIGRTIVGACQVR